VSQLVSKMYTEISCKYLYCLVNLQQLGVRWLAIARVQLTLVTFDRFKH